MNRRADELSLDLPLEIPVLPKDDPSMAAIFATVFAESHPHMNLEQALADPILSKAMHCISVRRLRDLQHGPRNET